MLYNVFPKCSGSSSHKAHGIQCVPLTVCPNDPGPCIKRLIPDIVFIGASSREGLERAEERTMWEPPGSPPGRRHS